MSPRSKYFGWNEYWYPVEKEVVGDRLDLKVFKDKSWRRTSVTERTGAGEVVNNLKEVFDKHSA